MKENNFCVFCCHVCSPHLHWSLPHSLKLSFWELWVNRKCRVFVFQLPALGATPGPALRCCYWSCCDPSFFDVFPPRSPCRPCFLTCMINYVGGANCKRLKWWGWREGRMRGVLGSKSVSEPQMSTKRHVPCCRGKRGQLSEGMFPSATLLRCL